jgi:heterotetrameric sarcosine oxidase gamma subunit
MTRTGRRCMSDFSIALAPLRSVAGIGGFRDQTALHSALQTEFGFSVPDGPACVEAGTVSLCRLGPSRYLVSGDREAGLPGRLARVLEGLAAVTDQSDLWVCFMASGASVRDVMSRVVPVDVRATKFAVGALASTRAGHLDVLLRRTGENAFEISVARSYAEDLRHLLENAATAN